MGISLDTMELWRGWPILYSQIIIMLFWFSCGSKLFRYVPKDSPREQVFRVTGVKVWNYFNKQLDNLQTCGQFISGWILAENPKSLNSLVTPLLLLSCASQLWSSGKSPFNQLALYLPPSPTVKSSLCCSLHNRKTWDEHWSLNILHKQGLIC